MAKQQGHYCRVCGQHKSNESFSGKGHASHICKACSGLSSAEKAELMALTRLENLPPRRLTDDEKKWLENRTHDKRPAVKELAREVYRKRFPHAERNAMKKQLRLNYVEFTINSMLLDEYGDEFPVRRQYTLERKEAILSMRELDGDGEPILLEMNPPDAAKLLKWMVHSLEIFCWDQDYCGENDDLSDFDIEEFLGLPPIEPGEQGEPVWSVQLRYADGREQNIESHDFGLPDRVIDLYGELNQYFPDGDDDEDGFDFVETALDCADLMELERLSTNLLTDAVNIQSDVLLCTALTDLLTLAQGRIFPPIPGKRPYSTHSGAWANLEFMRSFLVQAMAGEELVQTGRERLEKFTAFVRENITEPRGELISVSDLDRTMNALEKKYGLISRLSETGTLQILRIPNSHRLCNSLCNVVRYTDGHGSFRYEIYLFHVNGGQVGHPAYILLHEIGHALQVKVTHDPARIPESFCIMCEKFLHETVKQGAEAKEFFADMFAAAMMQTFGWDEYDPFGSIKPEVKRLFQTYYDWLMEKEFASKQR